MQQQYKGTRQIIHNIRPFICINTSIGTQQDSADRIEYWPAKVNAYPEDLAVESAPVFYGVLLTIDIYICLVCPV